MKRLILALFALASAVARAGDVASEKATMMSPYEVRANSVSFHGWIKRASPNFIVYTDANESRALTVLREFEMLRDASDVLFGRRGSHFSPTIIILPTAGSDWRKLEAKNQGVEWKFTSAMIGGRITRVLVAMYDWEARGLGNLRAVYSSVSREDLDIQAPFWFQHGLSSIYETAVFDGNHVNLGEVNLRVFTLKDGGWLPWDRFFGVNARSPEFVKEQLVSKFEGQTALFTQFLFANSDRSWTTKLIAWLSYLHTGSPPTEAQFTAIFGQDWKTWQTTMENYLERGKYSVYQVVIPDSVTHYAVAKTELPTREIRELFILSQTMLQNVHESPVSLGALIANGLQSKCLKELEVEACLGWNFSAEAQKGIRELIADGSTNARVYRAGDSMLTAYGGRFGLDCRYGPELAEVRAWDFRGLEFAPLYCDLNESIAVNEACAAVVDQQSITTIESCFRRVNGRAPTDKIIIALAMALWRIGENKSATELATKLENDPLVRKNYRAMATDLLGRISSTATKPAGT